LTWQKLKSFSLNGSVNFLTRILKKKNQFWILKTWETILTVCHSHQWWNSSDLWEQEIKKC
jgi:hypothetical protein